jgi:hypothetical protein
MNTTTKCQDLNKLKRENSSLTPVNTTEVNSLLLNKNDFLDKNNNQIKASPFNSSSTKKPLIKSLSLTTSNLLYRSNLRLSLKKQESQNKLKEAGSRMDSQNSNPSQSPSNSSSNLQQYQNIEVNVTDTSLPVINEYTTSLSNKNAQSKNFSKSSPNLKKNPPLNTKTPTSPPNSNTNTNVKSSLGAGLLTPSVSQHHHHHHHYGGGGEGGGGGRGRRESFLYRADINDADNSFTPKTPGLRSGSIISGEQ